MQASNRFQNAFLSFVQATYGEAANTVDYERLLLIYQEVFDSLLSLLVSVGITYDTFMEKELKDWPKSVDTGNPLNFPFERLFLDAYKNKDNKYSFIVLCLQTRRPEKDISAALIQACYGVLNGKPEWYSNVTNLLEFLSQYPNSASVTLVEGIIPLIDDELYSQDLIFAIEQVLAANPGALSTDVQQELTELETRIEEIRRAK